MKEENDVMVGIFTCPFDGSRLTELPDGRLSCGTHGTIDKRLLQNTPEIRYVREVLSRLYWITKHPSGKYLSYSLAFEENNTLNIKLSWR